MSEKIKRVPCDHSWDCPHLEWGCFEDIHHEYHPKRIYRTKLEKKFRDHVLNKTVMCRRLHDEEHKKPSPEKPSRDEMLAFFERVEPKTKR